jgi:acyl dehydratase
MTRLYEDIRVGEIFSFPEYTVTAEEITEFARQFDPQPFHLDAESSADSVFDDLVASGWHTASLSMRFLVETTFGDIAVLGGRGVDELRWYEPTYAGDRITGKAEITSMSRGDRGRGHVDFTVKIRNQNGTTIMSYTTLSMVRCRDQ